MKLYIPISNRLLKRQGIEKTIKKLHEICAVRVFLAIDRYFLDENKRREELSELYDNTRILKSEGFEVGAWLWAFAVDGISNEFTYITGIDGKTSKDEVCPFDDNYINAAGEYISKIAECGVDLIMFDDDYRFLHLGLELSCCCNKHMADICARLGENISREMLKTKLLEGGKNKYRNAWLASRGESLESFAAAMRAAVNRVNPAVRLGQCACISTWDADGTNSIKISKILAGNTTPFLRFIGAPYWAVEKSFGNTLPDVIELERMQSAWCAGNGIEIFSEGDVFPRPRYATPSSFLEIFDAALLADGKNDAILKYMFDYTSSSDYETGYLERHLLNEEIRTKIHELFYDKKDCGVYICQNYSRGFDVRNEGEILTPDYIDNLIFSSAARFFSQYSVPLNYTDSSFVNAVFGDSIKGIDNSKLNCTVVDLYAAEYLFSHGIDVGLNEVGETLEYKEFFSPEQNEYARNSITTSKRLIVKERCKIYLWFCSETEKTPAVYSYTNIKGQSFLVFNFDADFTNRNSLRNYLLQQALVNGIEDISNRKLPVKCLKNPDLYIICKIKENKIAVAAFNCSCDNILAPKFCLQGAVKHIKFVNTTGVFNYDTVITNDIPPFSLCCFEAEL